MMKISPVILSFLMIFLFFGCGPSTENYLFEKPVAFSIQKNVRCNNGSISYMGFVADDTSDYGTRIMKISGCGASIDKDFKDGHDDKRGIFAGGTPVSIDQTAIDGEVYIAVAVSGYTQYERSHKAKGYKETELENHLGRIALRKLKTGFAHDKSFDRSVLLDYNPYQIKAFKDGFVVTGSYFGSFHISFVPVDGEVVKATIPFFPTEMECHDRGCVLFNGEDGELYELDPSDISFELKASGYDTAPVKNRGIALLSKRRTLVFDGDRADVFDAGFNIIDSIDLPEGFKITSASGVNYGSTLLYRQFTPEDMFKKVELFAVESDDADSVDEELNDEELNDEELNDEELNDEDTDEDVLFEEVAHDASEGDIIWLASATGRVIAFDISKGSWLVSNYDESSRTDVPDHYKELRPYISNKYKTFPSYGKTDASNSPEITKITSIRGLFHSVFYKFSYEGVISGKDSVTGFYDSDEWLFIDERANFENDIISGIDSIILRGKKNSPDCMIPWNENAILAIDAVLDSNVLEVSSEKYRTQIADCYGDTLQYSIFPADHYSVSRTDNTGESFAGRGFEIGADESEERDNPSFSDDFASVWMKRMTDEVRTEREFSYFLRIRPGVPYIGFSSNDVMERMVEPVSGRVLMFSPLTRRLIEFDLVNGSIVKIYK
jgi:hypothetical protein